MKSLLFLAAIVAPGLAETAQFTNTSFTGPFTLGQSVPLAWTNGNGLPISLAITNATWNYKVFDGRAVLPTNYNWVVSAVPGFVSGNYQLTLEQLNGGVSTSPMFNVVLADNASQTNTSSAAPTVTATVTYVYWDDHCGCTKTGSALTPLATDLPITTHTWWDEDCGCHMSTMIPISTMPATNNYTVPAAPPPLTTAPPQNVAPAPPVTASSTTPATFTGGANRMASSILALAACVVAIAVA